MTKPLTPEEFENLYVMHDTPGAFLSYGELYAQCEKYRTALEEIRQVIEGLSNDQYILLAKDYLVAKARAALEEE